MDDDTHESTIISCNSGGGDGDGGHSVDGIARSKLLSPDRGSGNKMRPLDSATRALKSIGLHDGYKQEETTTTATTTTTTPNKNKNKTRTAHNQAVKNDTKQDTQTPRSGRQVIEQNFILSTLKGVANALKSSHRNSLRQQSACSANSRRPTSAISSATSPPVSSSSSSSSTTSTPHSTIGRRRMVSQDLMRAFKKTQDELDDEDQASLCSIYSTPRQTPSSSSNRRRSFMNNHLDHYTSDHHHHHNHRHSTPAANGLVDLELASNCSTSSSVSSNLSSSNILGSTSEFYTSNGHANGSNIGNDSSTICLNSTSSNNNFNVTISRNHMSLLESMKFDQTSDIESIKKDLIKICRENRLEILAHYVSQIG